MIESKAASFSRGPKGQSDVEATTLLTASLGRPIGAPPLRELAKGRPDAVILISDMSRLCPSDRFLSHVMDELNHGGVPDNRITIIVALGMHRRHTEDELRTLVGPAVYGRVRVVNHSAQEADCERVGTTSNGTPVSVNRLVLQASLRIATGNLEPHRLAGMSGGMKALVPGVAAHSTIEANHALSQRYTIRPGDPDNPIRRDLEEAQRFVPVHFLVNVIATPERDILAAFSGDVIAAHRAAVAAVNELFFIPGHRRYPLVIAAAGGHPKDLQLYQSVKALQNASDWALPGAPIVLAAHCPEMLGNGLLQYWLETKGPRESLVQELKRQFRLGPHKLEHIEHVLAKHPVYWHSAIPKPLVELLGFHPVHDVQRTIDRLTANLTGELRDVAVIPHSSLTFADFHASLTQG